MGDGREGGTAGTGTKGSEATGRFLVYRAEDGRTRIDVRLEDRTVWLSQKQLTALFGKAKGTVSEHIRHVFEDGELVREATVRRFRTVQVEGGREVEREVEHYNLDVVLAVGFRVRSPAGVRFRQWAADRLKEYLVKGFVLDDERLKDPRAGDYFDELSRRIQDIRTSERRFYQKITDIYATSIDYDPADPLTAQFFATVQNKVHYAIHGRTAAEVILDRADAGKPNMGLTAWQGARIRKSDVGVAKNYLAEDELRALNNLVEQYLRGGTGGAPHPHDHAGLDREAPRLPGAQRPGDPGERGQGLGRTGPGARGARVRPLPRRGGPGVRVGLRPGGEAVAAAQGRAVKQLPPRKDGR